MKYEIYTYGRPVLREKAEAIKNIDDSVIRLSNGMVEAMRKEKGLGLAAQQIGLTQAVCVIDLPPEFDVEEEGGPRLNPDISMPMILINPVILEKSGAVRLEEGCLSVPKLYASVQRAYEVLVSYVDVSGNERRLQARGLLARIIQHETDHLNGVLFVDKISKIAKISLSSKLKHLKEQNEGRD